MTKIGISLLILILLSSSLASLAQNTIVTDPDINRQILLGPVDAKGLALPLFVENWDAAFSQYQPDTEIIVKLKKFFRKNKDVSIKVFFGSWCGDSKDQMPNFLKIMTASKMKRVEYLALSRKKMMPVMDTALYKIDLVPTFIIYRNGLETGRIVETPNESLEKDLWNILNIKKEK